MEIKIEANNCIITVLSPFLFRREVSRLAETLEEYSKFKIGINMDNVIDCSVDFIEMLERFNNINLYNIASDISAILYKMGLDKRINLYNSEIDFMSSSHRLLNRNLKLVRIH